MQRFRRFINSPITQLTTGLILLVSGLSTAYYEFIDAGHSLRFGLHHGVSLFALVQVLGSLPDLIDGIDRSIQVVEQHRENR
jgi:hypothetical protein